MDNNHISELLPAYLDKALDNEQQHVVEQHLESCSICTATLAALSKLNLAFENESEISPSTQLRANFFEQIALEKENNSKMVNLDSVTKRNKHNWINNMLKIAASIVLLVGVYFFGRQQESQRSDNQIAILNTEKAAFKQAAMLSLMENKSASRRIQGVNYMQEFDQPDTAIVAALTDRMLYDENTNVRAAAVEVLANCTSSEQVKNTFIEALKVEKDPGIQIAIIQTLGRIQEKKAAKPMQKLLDQEETQPFVKEQIESVLTTII
jgi:hypothetical protein